MYHFLTFKIYARHFEFIASICSSNHQCQLVIKRDKISASFGNIWTVWKSSDSDNSFLQRNEQFLQQIDYGFGSF